LDDTVRFEEFVSSRAHALMRYGFVLTGNPHDAADLMQEALLRVRSAWSRLDAARAAEAYVRTTMARLHISLWRRRRRERLVADVPDRSAASSTAQFVDTTELWELLETLPRRQRAVLVLRYYESLTDEEIAGVLGISRGTVRSQAFHALKKLRVSWAAENGPATTTTTTTSRKGAE
jgi:RNA polymerase sigma-70 factor (sigma-E family)